MKHSRTFLALTLGITLLLGIFSAVPASAASTGEFVSKVNGLRASKGLGALNVDSRLSGQAQAWAEQMAKVNKISHNPNLGGTPGNWTKVGENVGTGGTVDAIFNALVASPGHYRNMADGGFNSIGVGIAMGSDGRIYTCHVFAAFPGSNNAASSKSVAPPAPKTPAPTAAPKPAAKPKVASAPTATPVTAAPSAPVEAAPAVPVAPPAPVAPAVPSRQILNSLSDVSSLATQG